jgi:hypothetical protein
MLGEAEAADATGAICSSQRVGDQVAAQASGLEASATFKQALERARRPT